MQFNALIIRNVKDVPIDKVMAKEASFVKIKVAKNVKPNKVAVCHTDPGINRRKSLEKLLKCRGSSKLLPSDGDESVEFDLLERIAFLSLWCIHRRICIEKRTNKRAGKSCTTELTQEANDAERQNTHRRRNKIDKKYLKCIFSE
jgi:hypothetical protein